MNVSAVMAGLDPAIHLFRKMDHRVSRHSASKTRVNALMARPGDDEGKIVIDDKGNDFFKELNLG